MPVDRAILVVNAHSRRGRDLFDNATRILKERGLTLDAHAVDDPKRLPGIVRDAVARAEPLVIVGGGDGTVSSVVDHVARTDTTLGVLPLGTANSFARTLDVPMDLDGAIEVVLAGKTARVDLGHVDGDLFANAAAIGLPSLINADIPAGLKRSLGRLGYMLYGARVLAGFDGFRCTIDTGDGSPQTLDAMEVRVVNGSFLGGVKVAGSDNVENRTIEVQVVTGRSRSGLIGTWAREARGAALPPGALRSFEGREVTIACDPPQPVSIDGEVLRRTPIRAGVVPQSLKVRVPLHRRDLD